MSSSDEKQAEDENYGVTISSRLFSFLIVGFVLVFIGIIVIVVASVFAGGSGSVGGVVFIGPIPIVFGAGPDASWLILISVIITVLSIVFYIVMSRRNRSG